MGIRDFNYFQLHHEQSGSIRSVALKKYVSETENSIAVSFLETISEK